MELVIIVCLLCYLYFSEAYIKMSMIWDRNSTSRFLSVYFLTALALFLVYSRLEHQVSLVYSSYSLPGS